MSSKSDNIQNHIASLSIKKFNELPKTGKPNLKEWTILACIVKQDLNDDNLEVVALGTGSKCIGENKMSPQGDILNDSHAEVICRRAFIKYIYDQIKLTFDGNISIFNTTKNKKCFLKTNIKFHFFCTQLPCGDASIFSRTEHFVEFIGPCIDKRYESKKEGDNSIDDLNSKFPKRTIDNSENLPNKKHKFQNDIYRTGAKCLYTEKRQDLFLQGPLFHTVGAVRTKPGRGDPTKSVSCSDKFARWIRVGIQGAFLTLLLNEPIYLSTIIIAKNTPYSKEALKRALQDRFEDIKLTLPFSLVVPNIYQCDINFEYSRTENTIPCPSSMIWSLVRDRPFEVSVEGKKQGITKKNKHLPNAQLSICKKQLGTTFMEVINKYKLSNIIDNEININYKNLKLKAYDYYETWNKIKTCIFQVWTEKSDNLLQFNLTSNNVS